MENKNNLSEHFFHFSDKTLQSSLRDCQDLFEKNTNTLPAPLLYTDMTTTLHCYHNHHQHPTTLNILISADCSDVLLFFGKYRDITDTRLYIGRNEIL